MDEENRSNSNTARSFNAKPYNTSKSEHKALLEVSIAKLWQEVLGLPVVGLEDNFFEMGGTSLIATVLLTKLNQTLNLSLPIATVFEYPTVRSMAEFLSESDSADVKEVTPAIQHKPIEKSNLPTAVAIIGMTGRFPGADSVEDFWANLCDGVESISFFDREELESQERVTGLPPNYVAARPILKNAPMFDADFFGIYPKEAEQMDPQHRVFLECAWEVLERAG